MYLTLHLGMRYHSVFHSSILLSNVFSYLIVAYRSEKANREFDWKGLHGTGQGCTEPVSLCCLRETNKNSLPLWETGFWFTLAAAWHWSTLFEYCFLDCPWTFHWQCGLDLVLAFECISSCLLNWSAWNTGGVWDVAVELFQTKLY